MSKFLILPLIFIAATVFGCNDEDEKNSFGKTTQKSIACELDTPCVLPGEDTENLNQKVQVLSADGNHGGGCESSLDMCFVKSKANLLVLAKKTSELELHRYDCNSDDNIFNKSYYTLNLSLQALEGSRSLASNVEVYVLDTNSLETLRESEEMLMGLRESDGKLIVTGFATVSTDGVCELEDDVATLMSNFKSCESGDTRYEEEDALIYDKANESCSTPRVEEPASGEE